MSFDYFAGIKVYRPSTESELRLRNQAENNLRANFPVGRFTNGRDINSILQHQFGFYEAKLNDSLPKVASRNLMEFLLFQYDESFRINEQVLTREESQRWDQLAPKFRRAIKYLCERVALLAPSETPSTPKTEAFEYIDECFISAEAMVDLYIMSEQTYGLFPNDTILQILPPAQADYFTLGLTAKYQDCLRFIARVDRDTPNRKRFVPEFQLDIDSVEQAKVLDPCFDKAFGISYSKALSLIVNISDQAEPPRKGFPIPFCRLESVLDEVAKWGVKREVASRIIAGFTLRRDDMLAEGRALWKPKQENRAYRRAFFEFPHPTGTHLIWSKNMVTESFVFLLSGAVYQKLPSEWLTPEINKGLATLSNLAGGWFENVVAGNLKTLGIVGQAYKAQIGTGLNAVIIPSGIGQIDFLGFSASEHLMIVCEDKMVEGGLEPKYFRDALSQFVRARDNYAERFRKKVDWISQNREAITRALNMPGNSANMACALVTLYPSFASYFIEDFPCVSITEFMLDYEARGKWPYTIGRRG